MLNGYVKSKYVYGILHVFGVRIEIKIWQINKMGLYVS